VAFEERIRDKELHNPKFCFLNPNDPYHKYYQLQIKTWKEGKQNGASGSATTGPQSATIGPQSATTGPQSATTGPQSATGPQPPPLSHQAPVIEKTIPLPPPANEFLTESPSLSKQDIDILKLTAQFVARNGTKFMAALSQREHKNYQFDFLRPSHNLYPYFTKLVEQYTRILVPPRNLFSVLEEQAINRYKVLEEIMKKVEYEGMKNTDELITFGSIYAS
jgi:splicing factor 3A subunit 1